MPYSLNMNASQVEAARLEYPKILTRQEVYRYSGTFVGAVTSEIFLDGLANKRLQIPANSSAVLSYDMVTTEFTTTTGAIVSSVASVGGRFGALNVNGVVTAVANPVAATVMPTAQVIALVTPAANDTFDAITLSVATTGAATTKVVEIVAFVVIANRASVISGLS